VPNCRVYPPEYQELVGCDVETGSIVAVAFIEESKEFTDITNPYEWINLTLETDILIHKQTRGLYQKFASTEVEGKGKSISRVSGRKHAAVFKVDSVKGNDPYWNILNKSTNYKFAFILGANYDTMFYINKPVSIDAGPDIKRNLDSQAEWLITVKWSDLVLPSPSDVPEGIFDGTLPVSTGFPYVFDYILS